MKAGEDILIAASNVARGIWGLTVLQQTVLGYGQKGLPTTWRNMECAPIKTSLGTF
jgi:hypothetical protein